MARRRPARRARQRSRSRGGGRARARSRSRAPVGARRSRSRSRSASRGVSGGSSSAARAAAALGQAVGGGSTGFANVIPPSDRMDVVVSSGWHDVKAKVEVTLLELQTDKKEVYLEKIKNVSGARPVAAFIEVDHFGVAGYAGRLRYLAHDGDEATLKYEELGSNSSHRWCDFSRLPCGKLEVASFGPRDFDTFHGGNDFNVPKVSVACNVAGVPPGVSEANVVFRMRVLLLCYTRRPVL